MNMTRTTLFSLAGIGLALALGSCGPASTNVQRVSLPTDFTTPYAIVTNETAIRSYTESYVSMWTSSETNYASFWTPTKQDIEPIRKALTVYVDNALKAPTATDRKPDAHANYTYIKNNIEKYFLECGGVIRNGRKQIICQMLINRNTGSQGRTDGGIKQNFSQILDGGVGVVHFCYDVETGEVMHVCWNGVA